MAIIEQDYSITKSRQTRCYKKPKGQFVKQQAKSDSFWRRKFMQVLEAMHDTELTWAKDQWSLYGISDHEAKVIEKEFERQKAWRASRESRLNKNSSEEMSLMA